MTADLDYSADCSKCAALCCIAFPFEQSAAFGEDKPAGQACSRLETSGRCSIHARRQADGYGGCVIYDCHGAGPWVTQVLFGGRSWLDDTALRAPMCEAFLKATGMRRLLVLLREAGKLDLTSDDRALLDALSARAAGGAHPGAETDGLEPEVFGFLATLRRYVESPSAR